MGKRRKPRPVKLICGLIFKEEDSYLKAKESLRRHFGSIDYESKAVDFDYTDYYEKEFGKDLKRSFLSFKKPVPPSKLAEIKIATNRIESRLSREGCRLVNIDPGYLDLAKLILASTKDFSHRIYLRHGIYAETTLIYQDGKFKDLAWTYPDYKTPAYQEIFQEIRNLYSGQF